jgi:hypothetical protein
MKILSLICIIVVLALNCVPCADAYESEVVQTVVTVGGHQDAPVHTDECTPFCHCSCCASTVVVRLIASPAVPFKINNFSYVPHFAGASLDVDLPIFQPPKLV